MGAEASTETLSRGDAGADGDAGVAPYLFVVLDARRVDAPPARVALASVDEVAIGRGDARSIQVAGQRVLLALPDAGMSRSHARVKRAFGGWIVEDAGSKNGTLVGGRPVARAELADGDVIEVGRTFLLFRRSLPFDPAAPALLDAASRPSDALGAPGIFTLSPVFERALAALRRVAPAPLPVILEGETGTGKEVAARAVHALSGRRGAFVAVNCGALPAALVEGQLFGHRRGAFSGATEDRPGLFRAADGGTLLLDEVGELPLAAQAALLRALEQREVLPVGATLPVSIDVRVISATHRPLDRLVEEGAFRRDLHARLAGLRLVLPPLRDRREDLGQLAGALLARAGASPLPALDPRAARALLAADWPGNVRQLEKCLAAAHALAGGGAITLDHLPADLRGPSAVSAASVARAPDPDAAQRDALVSLLREHRGNVSAVARALGKARMQVQRWLKRYSLDPEAFRAG
jgi:transcriptional regulator of acetoin/glycerol metabolism